MSHLQQHAVGIDTNMNGNTILVTVATLQCQGSFMLLCVAQAAPSQFQIDFLSGPPV